MTSDERWLGATWPFVREHLPAPPARVLEIGCGPLGGFVPPLLSSGYDATGVDPEAPEADHYHRVEFERYPLGRPMDALVASTSLHHVHDLSEVLDRVVAALLPGGVLVVVEWAWERLDQPTVQWCFDRMAPPDPESEPGWLHRRRDEWAASGLTWDAYRSAWAAGEGLHTSGEILRELDARFDRRLLAYTPYFFPELAGVAEADERAAAEAGAIQATGIRYVAHRTA